METKNTLQKQESFAFGKRIFLIGQDSEGINYWLEEPKWDCGWYWGFGYIETYTNNKNPRIARDISSHQHFSGFVGQQEKYDFDKKCFVKDDYIHNIYDSKKLKKTTFSEKEGWQLSELFKQFYLLQDMAEFCHKKPVVGCNITTVKEVDNNNSVGGWYDEINKVMIPKITARILEILSVDIANLPKDSQA